MWNKPVQWARIAVVSGIISIFSAPNIYGKPDDEPLFQFGAIADCQYHDSEGERRKYNQSPDKLRACIADFNQQELSHVVHLGDFIDRDWSSFDVVLPIAAESKAPFYHALEDHDFSVAEEHKAKVPERLGLSERYYEKAVRRSLHERTTAGSLERKKKNELSPRPTKNQSIERPRFRICRPKAGNRRPSCGISDSVLRIWIRG